MVSLYPSPMYRQQTAPNGHFNNNHMHSWYTGGYPQPGPMNAHPGYVQQDEQMSWHHQHGHGVFPHNPEYSDLTHHAGIPPIHPHTGAHVAEHQLPSPPITVSGSDMSSPGTQNGNLTPPQMGQNGQNPRPTQARSPYEWITKNSYQREPNPGKTRTKDKYRVVYTDHQRIELEKEFTFINKYITIGRKAELAASLGLSERQVKIWFQNRRAKERKQHKKRAEEKNQIEMFNQNIQATMMTQQPSQSPNGVYASMQQQLVGVSSQSPNSM